MVEIIPAVYPIPKTLKEFRESVSQVTDLVPLIQLDVMDGQFVPSTSWPYGGGEKEFMAMVGKRAYLPEGENLDYEVDLMVKNPEEVIEDWMHLGVRRIIVHVEATEKMENIINDVAAHVTLATSESAEVVALGIALNIGTPTERIEPYLDQIEFVQFMGIASIGKQGEPFDERVLKTISTLRNTHPELIISADGGVNFDSAPLLIEAGVNRLVSGSAIGKSESIEEAIRRFKDLAA